MHTNITCSRRSDRGAGGRQGTVERDVSTKKHQRGGGVGVRALFTSLFFPRSLPSRHTPLSERLEQANNNNVVCPTDRTRLIIRVRLRLLSRLEKKEIISVLFCHLEVRKYSKLSVSCRTVVLISQSSRHI